MNHITKMLDIESSTEQAHASRKVVWSDYLRVTGIISDAGKNQELFSSHQHIYFGASPSPVMNRSSIIQKFYHILCDKI